MHRAGRDVEGLDDVRADEVRRDEREHDEERPLQRAAAGPAAADDGARRVRWFLLGRLLLDLAVEDLVGGDVAAQELGRLVALLGVGRRTGRRRTRRCPGGPPAPPDPALPPGAPGAQGPPVPRARQCPGADRWRRARRCRGARKCRGAEEAGPSGGAGPSGTTATPGSPWGRRVGYAAGVWGRTTGWSGAAVRTTGRSPGGPDASPVSGRPAGGRGRRSAPPAGRVVLARRSDDRVRGPERFPVPARQHGRSLLDTRAAVGRGVPVRGSRPRGAVDAVDRRAAPPIRTVRRRRRVPVGPPRPDHQQPARHIRWRHRPTRDTGPDHQRAASRSRRRQHVTRGSGPARRPAPPRSRWRRRPPGGTGPARRPAGEPWPRLGRPRYRSARRRGGMP